jgi:cytidine deaminase
MLSLDIEQKLVEAAEEGIKNCFTTKNLPGDYRIGASVLTDKGNIYSSGYYKSDTGSLTLHAEQACLAHAAAHGEYAVVAIAITWNDAAVSLNHNESIYPCHMCKQLLWESHLRSGKDMEIIIVEKGKIIERLILTEIMNYTWPK